jgi:hypothetical protein
MTIHHSAETATPDATKRYPSDLNDREFGLVAPYGAQKAASVKKRIVDIREVLNAILYRTRTGCQWRMLPSDFPPGIMSGIIIALGAMMAHGSTSTRYSAAM